MSSKTPTVAIAVGPLQSHPRRFDAGKQGLTGATEMEIMSPLARRVEEELLKAGMEVVLIDSHMGIQTGDKRKESWAWIGEFLEAVQPDFTIGIRCRAAKRVTACGYIYYHWGDSGIGEAICHDFADKQYEWNPKTKRYRTGVKQWSHMDSSDGNLLGLSPCPAIVSYPFHSTHPHEWMFYLDNFEGYVNFYVERITYWVNSLRSL